MKSSFPLSLSFVCCLIGSSLQPPSVSAQSITSDGTLPTPTEVTENGNISEIRGGTARGSNLFHSFRNFSVGAEGTADFLNADNISNIFSRVTGGNISNIDGLLRTNDASLFLINPAGIIFGEGARLDLGGGSFYGSSADSILFEDGDFSTTDLENPPLITINAPIGLNLRDNPEPITVKSVADDMGLEVSTGATLALIGGDIEIEGGKITVPGGRVELGGLSAAGTVNFNEDGGFTFPDDVARADVTLTDGAVVNVRAGGGGFITVNANNLELLEGDFLAGIKLDMGSPEAQGGDITIDSTGSVSLTTGSQLSIGVFGQGNGGNVIINAKDKVLFDGVGNGFPSAAFSTIREEGEGKAGNIEITAGSLTLQNEGSLVTDTFGQGNAGSILVQADGAVDMIGGDIFSNVERGGRGNGGEINIQAESLSLTNGAQIQSGLRGSSEELSGGRGNGGEVNIDVRDTVTFSGVNESGLSSAIFTDVESGAIGNGGDINIKSRSLLIENGGSLVTDTSGQGNAGNIEVKAASLTLENGGSLVTDTFGQGNAGNIIIRVDDRANFNDGSSVLSRVGGELIGSTGTGNGGEVDIEARSIFITDGANIITQTVGNGNAGNIKLNAADSIVISGVSPVVREDGGVGGFSSGLFSTTEPGANGIAGKISVTSANLQVLDGATISARSRSDFQGGNIVVDADKLDIQGGGQILTTAFSNGNAGDIILNVSDEINILESDPTFFERINQVKENFEEEFGEDIANFVIDPVSPESGIFANTQSDSTGDGGNITIGNPTQFTRSMTLADSGTISAASQGEGTGGTISIWTGDLTLDNQAQILAETASPQAEGVVPSEVKLTIDDNLILQDNSTISAQAFQDADGGNIDIDADFIIAFPSSGDGNDIIASAAGAGKGGNINITTNSIFNMRQGKAIPGNGTNDLDASSKFGLDGNITIDSLDADPFQETPETPESIIETDTLVVGTCDPVQVEKNILAGRQNSFVVKGKGGIPPEPTEPLNSDAIWINGQIANPNPQADHPDIKPIKTTVGDVYPARGVIVTESGEIILTAYPTDNIDRRTPKGYANCGKL